MTPEELIEMFRPYAMWNSYGELSMPEVEAQQTHNPIHCAIKHVEGLIKELLYVDTLYTADRRAELTSLLTELKGMI